MPEEQYSKSEAEEAINMAKEVLNWVKRIWRSLGRESSREGNT